MGKLNQVYRAGRSYAREIYVVSSSSLICAELGPSRIGQF